LFFGVGRAVCASAQIIAQPEWLNALRKGGHVIVLRHGADRDPLKPRNVAQRRQLDEQGEERLRSRLLRG
jgi:hypothetical protein